MTTIRMNMKIEQVLTDIVEIKSRLQALEKAYSERPMHNPAASHNDFLPARAAPDSHNPVVSHNPAVSRETLRFKGLNINRMDKRTKEYKEYINSIKNRAQETESQ